MIKDAAIAIASLTFAASVWIGVSFYNDALQRPNLPNLDKYKLTQTIDVGLQTDYEYSHVVSGELSEVITEKSGFLVRGIFVPSKVGPLYVKQYAFSDAEKKDDKKDAGYPKDTRPTLINLLCQQTIFATESCYQILER